MPEPEEYDFYIKEIVYLFNGNLKCVITDLLQDNDLDGIKCHGIIHGYKIYNVSSNYLISSDYDYIKYAYFNQQTENKLKRLEVNILRKKEIS
ncbi:7901_t:CDS:2 [Funneliformis mosseae]|uniref:7901_t:CDS:1 n=1 Tax=Funneliformis mosseae TaxID=27381 RepID=A0A9N8V1P2_FUNMO|nr:7901_t:CDS:2 [Funneliformis mosseae]